MIRWLLLAVFLVFVSKLTLGQKPAIPVHVISDCPDEVGTVVTSQLREKIRGSNGYSLTAGSDHGYKGLEIVLTCRAIPNVRATASAVSYIFHVIQPGGISYFMLPSIGIVGKDGTNDWVQQVFAQFDDWATKIQKGVDY